MKKSHSLISVVACLILAGCASDPNLLTDVLGTIEQTGMTAIQAAEVYAAVQANNNGQPVTLTSVLSDINVSLAQAKSTGLDTQIDAYLTQINKDIMDAQSKNATTQAIVAATSATVVAGQLQLQAVAPAAVSTSHFYFHLNRQTGKTQLVCLK